MIEYICEELDELEKKVSKDGKLSVAEIEYASKLADTKKNLLKADEMMDDGEYSMEQGGSSYARRGGSSYARGGRGGGRGGNRGGGGRTGSNQYGSYAMNDGSYARGGYSRGGDMLVEELRDLAEDAPDESIRADFHKLIRKLEQM